LEHRAPLVSEDNRKHACRHQKIEFTLKPGLSPR
jgi:hypothetical protein